MFEGDCKVSLHASGDCQLSGTSAWVLKVPGRRNAERHIMKWHSPRPSGSFAVHVFQIRIPDLQAFATEEDISTVYWLPQRNDGSTVSLECYFTPPADRPPIGENLSFPLLCALKLYDHRWFMIFHRNVPPDTHLLKRTRESIRRIAHSRGINLISQYRACATMDIEPPTKALIELCPLM